MPEYYNLDLTADELRTIINNLSESAARWHIISQESPFPEARESARLEWVALLDILAKIDPPIGI